MLQDVGGVREAIYFTGQRALGVDVETGKLLWSYDRVANSTANIATPIVRGNRVFLSSAYGTGAALLEMSPEQRRHLGARGLFHARHAQPPRQLAC